MARGLRLVDRVEPGGSVDRRIHVKNHCCRVLNHRTSCHGGFGHYGEEHAAFRTWRKKTSERVGWGLIGSGIKGLERPGQDAGGRIQGGADLDQEIRRGAEINGGGEGSD